MQLLNTLYVTLPDAWLRLDNDTLRVAAHFNHGACNGPFRTHLNHFLAHQCTSSAFRVGHEFL